MEPEDIAQGFRILRKPCQNKFDSAIQFAPNLLFRAILAFSTLDFTIFLHIVSHFSARSIFIYYNFF